MLGVTPMADSAQALAGPDEVLVHLDPIQAAQVRCIAKAWGITAEQVIQGLICNRLCECAAGLVDLVPSGRAAH